MQKELFENTPNLSVVEGSVDDILLSCDNRCTGVLLGNTVLIFLNISQIFFFVLFLVFLIENGTLVKTKCVVLTTGTFLNGEMFSGMTVKPGGRINSKPSIRLANTLKKLGFKTGRMKTGTPPRIDKQSIDFTNLEHQLGDDSPIPFSFMNDSVWIKVNTLILTLI